MTGETYYYEVRAYDKARNEDTGAAKATTHFYRVTALYADGTESAVGGDSAVMAP